MTVLGQQQTHALTRLYALLAEVVPQIPGATERHILWFQGFNQWWLTTGRYGPEVDPITADRRRVQARIAEELERLNPTIAAAVKAAQEVQQGV